MRRRGGSELLGRGGALVGDAGQDDRRGARKERPGHGPEVLVPHGREDEDDRPADDVFEVCGQRLGTFGIVGPVEEDERAAPDRLEPAFPVGLANGLEDLLLIEGLPDLGEHLGRGDGNGGIGALVTAGQAGREGVTATLARVDEPVAVADARGLERPSLPEDLGEGRVPVGCDPADLAERRSGCDAADRRDARLEDAGLLEGDLLERRAEVFLVVLGDRRDHGDEGADDVGRVEPAAHARPRARRRRPRVRRTREKPGRSGPRNRSGGRRAGARPSGRR